MSVELKNMWKVPFRQVYCETLYQCLKQSIHCFIVTYFKTGRYESK